MKRQTLTILAATILLPSYAAAQQEVEATDEALLAQQKAAVEVSPPDPQELPSGQQGTVHTVVKGDTLWDLTEKYLGSPWYWPKVWSYNPQIDNPHMIYPGNTIRFDMADSGAAAEEMPAQLKVTQPEEEEAGLTTAAADEEIREYMDDELVTVSEGKSIGMATVAQGGNTIRQDSFLSAEEFKAAGKIDSAFSEKRMLSIYDKVYLTFEDMGAVHLGDVYTIFRPGDEIHHPVSGDTVGYQINTIGTVRVTALHSDRITAIVASANDEVLRGDLVSNLAEFDRKMDRVPSDNDEDVRGIVMAAQNPLLPLLGEHHMVFIDKGSNDGVKVGNAFEVVRSGDPTIVKTEENESDVYPEETVALIQVIDVNESTCVGIIVRSLYEISVGENVVLRSSKAKK